MHTMLDRAPSLTVLIPELLRLPVEVYQTLRPAVRKRFETCLSRAEVNPSVRVGLEPQLLSLAGVTQDASQDWPIAAFSWLGEGCAPFAQPVWWMRCDPIHLRADRDQLLAFPSGGLDITSAEAQDLTASVNAHFHGDGWQLHAPHPQRWYITNPTQLGIRNYDFDEICGRAVGAYLPIGPQARHWRAVVNELQMLLYSHAVNQTRQARGQLSINGVWLWGVGPLPASTAKLPWQALLSDDVCARGVARQHAITPQAVPTDYATWSADHAPAATLMVLSSLRDAVWQADERGMQLAITHLLEQWLLPAWDAVAAGKLSEFTVYACDGRSFRWTRALLRRFWRRHYALDAWRNLMAP